MAMDAAEPLNRIKEPRLAADDQVEAAVAVGDDVEAGPSCASMIAATASRYCSRNSESPSAALNDRPSRLLSNHKGRG